MKKIFSCAICLILILIVFSSNIYAKSNNEKYVWQKINHYYTGIDINSIAYSGKLYVVVGDKGLILSSHDGLSWERQYCGYENDLCKITWNGKYFEIKTNYEGIFCSTDGTKWEVSVPNNKNPSTIKKESINLEGKNDITYNKMFGYVEGKTVAIAVGESGTILYGIKKGQPLVKQQGLTTNSPIIDKLGNSVVLFVGRTQMFIENNFTEEISKPFTIKSGENEIVYVPIEKIIKGLGGTYKYSSKLSTAYITYKNKNIVIKVGSKAVKLNDQDVVLDSTPVLKGNTVFAPLNMFVLLGKQVCIEQKIIVISDITTFFNKEKENLIIDALMYLSVTPDYFETSLTQRIVEVLFHKGNILFYSKKHENTVVYYKMAEAVEPTSELYNFLGLSMDWLGNDYEAVEYYNKGIKLNCFSSEILTNKGDSLSILEDYDGAMECFNKANSINPDNAWTQLSIAKIEYYKGNYKNAIIKYDEIIKKFPKFDRVYIYKAYSFMCLENYTEAIECLNKAIKLDPYNMHSYWNKGICLYELQKYSDAITAFNNALELEPVSNNILEKKGDALCKLNRYEEAITEYAKAININPNVVSFHEKMGDALTYLKRFDEAFVSYDNAIKHAHGDEFNRLIEKKSELLYSMKKYEQLVSELEGLQYNTGYVFYYKALGNCAQGKFNEAIKNIKLAIRGEVGFRKKVFNDKRFVALVGREDYKEIFTEIKLFMDDTFEADGAAFFEENMFKGVSFYKAKTVGSTLEDDYTKQLAFNVLVNICYNPNITDVDSAIKYGVYKDSPLLVEIGNFCYSDEDEKHKTEYKLLNSEIIICGTENATVKYVVIHTKLQTIDYDNKKSELDDYSLLIKDEGTWKFFSGLY